MENMVPSKIKFWAQAVEKFVEHNLMEKEHRDENLKKLALAFESLLKDSPLKKPLSKIVDGEDKKPVRVLVKKLAHFKGELPRYQSEGASGLDVRAQIEASIEILPGARALIPTGLSVAIPEGYEIQARPRSGWAMRDGISLLNTPGTIDADYRGEIKIIVVNLGEKPVTVKDQDRIAQLVVCPVVQATLVEVDDLNETARGEGGFGSTGRA